MILLKHILNKIGERSRVSKSVEFDIERFVPGVEKLLIASRKLEQHRTYAV